MSKSSPLLFSLTPIHGATWVIICLFPTFIFHPLPYPKSHVGNSSPSSSRNHLQGEREGGSLLTYPELTLVLENERNRIGTNIDTPWFNTVVKFPWMTYNTTQLILKCEMAGNNWNTNFANCFNTRSYPKYMTPDYFSLLSAR